MDKSYLEGGENALVNKRKPRNLLAQYENRKSLALIKQFEYKIALLEREALKKDAEIVDKPLLMRTFRILRELKNTWVLSLTTVCPTSTQNKKFRGVAHPVERLVWERA